MHLRTDSEKRGYSNLPIVILMILMYVIVAMSDNLKGIFVPLFKEDFRINNTQIGYILTASMLSYAIFQFIGGILVEKIGYKKVLSLGFIISIISLFVLITCKIYSALIIGLFILNSGIAMFNVGVNTLGPVLTVSSTAVLMNIVNFSYGVGNTAMQKIAGTLLSKGVPWQRFYVFMLICCLLLFLYLILIKIPYTQKDKALYYKKSDLLKNKLLYLYIAALGFYMASEYGIGNWFVNYMDQGFNLDADKRSLYVALFFGFITLGRLFGGFIVDKLGHYKSIIIYGTIASVLSILGIAAGKSGLLIFSVSGLFFSIIYPTIITTIQGVFKDAASYATGIILMCGTLIAMSVSMLIGILNDLAGVGYSFYIIGMCLIITTLVAVNIKKQIS